MRQKKSLGSVSIEWIDRSKVIAQLEVCAQHMGTASGRVEACILYGSLLREDYSPDSDIDILIVVDFSTMPFLVRCDEYRDFFGQLPFDIDLKAYTREEIQYMLAENNPFIVGVFEEGKVLWSLDDKDYCQKAVCRIDRS